MPERDTSRDGLANKIELYVLTHFEPLWRFLNRTKTLGDIVNAILIDRAVKKTSSRPFPFSTLADYTSWRSLTDRTWFARQLPPKPQVDLPPIEEVVALFERAPGKGRLSDKSTLLFASFAQWFTDGLLMTVDKHPRNTSSKHQIDLNPLYGLERVVTLQLRLLSDVPGKRGRMKSEIAGGEEFAPRLFQDDGINQKDEFSLVPPPLRLAPDWPVEKRRTLFAFGGERANSTAITAALNTLFLREHNRIAGVLEAAHPDWKDEQVFETTRNTVIVILIKLVVEEYINHISIAWFRLRCDPKVAWNQPWNKPNWIPVEFNLLYRWHGLIPDEFEWKGRARPIWEIFYNNEFLLGGGLGEVLDQASRQKAGQVGLFNTTPTLIISVEKPSIQQGRDNELASYNDYREAVAFPRVTRFEQISDDPKIVEGLRRVYQGDIDKVEFFVGLFAEQLYPHPVVPPLIGRMVAMDAFSLALPNPLLSERVFNARTFGAEGMSVITATKRLRDIVARNAGAGAGSFLVSMDQDRDAGR